MHRWGAFVILVAAWTPAAYGRGGQPQALTAGAAVDRPIAANARHSYTLFVAAGQAARIQVDARDIDVTIRTFDPEGALAARVEVRLNRGSSTTLVAAATGTYRVEIGASARPARGGSYRVVMTDLVDASAEDRARAAAEAAYTRGEDTSGSSDGGGPTEARRRSLAFFEEAQRLWAAAQDRAGEARALYRMGTVYMNLGEYAQAVNAHRQSAAIRHELGDRFDEATSVYNTAINLFYLAEFTEAKPLYERAAALQREVGNVNGEAFSLSSLGVLHDQLGDSVTAMSYYEQAIARWRQVENRRGEGLGLHNLGSALMSLGENQRALDALKEAAALRGAAGDRAGEAQSLSMLANAYRRVGEIDRAREMLESVVPIRRQLGDRRGEGYSLQGLAQVQLVLRLPREAIPNAERSIELLSAIRDRDGEGSGLSILGVALTQAGEVQKAQDALRRALEIHRAIGNRRMEVQSLVGLGEALARGADPDRALDHLNTALALARERRLASLELEARIHIGRVVLERGDPAGAQMVLQPAIDTLESWRTGITSPDQRLALRSARESAYELYLEVLMDLDRRHPGRGHAADGLQFAERTRARGLVDLLAESGVDIREGVDAGLRERERTLDRQIRQQSARLDTLARDEKRATEATEAERGLAALAADHADVQRRLRLSSPNYSALTQPSALTLANIQQLLGDDDLLLEYAVGEQRSYLWAIRRASMTVHALPGRKALNEATRLAHDLVAGSHRVEARGQAREATARLGELLLRPVAGVLGRRRLIIVPDEGLQLVPFAAVTEPGTGEPLIARHELVMLPSVSAVVALRAAPRPAPAPGKVVALLADPVFDAKDPRVKPGSVPPGRRSAQREGGTPAPSPVEAPSPADARGADSFERLPFSREEADAIVAVAGRSAVHAALDFDASRAAAISPDFATYPILHFATHAIIDVERPALSGIVLSRVDRDGQPQDGWLRLHDIYNLKLAADLVVLSACRTARGRDLGGEGFVGLTRGFMYAGAQSLLASLWDVRDEATAELMRRFYAALLRDRLTPAAALRKAQLSMARDPAWSAPSYWAGFLLHGDWKGGK